MDCQLFGHADVEIDEFIVLRSRYTLKLLKNLDETKSTGPDPIPAAILRPLAQELAVPFIIG